MQRPRNKVLTDELRTVEKETHENYETLCSEQGGKTNHQTNSQVTKKSERTETHIHLCSPPVQLTHCVLSCCLRPWRREWTRATKKPNGRIPLYRHRVPKTQTLSLHSTPNLEPPKTESSDDPEPEQETSMLHTPHVEDREKTFFLEDCWSKIGGFHNGVRGSETHVRRRSPSNTDPQFSQLVKVQHLC